MATPGSAPLPPASSPTSEIDRLRAQVAVYFPVYETRVTANSLVLLVHIDAATLDEKFDRLRQELWAQYYVPQVRHERGEYLIEVVRRPTRRPWGPVVNLVLLALTVVTTFSAGAFLWLAYVGGTTLSGSDFLWGGLYFGLPLMTILGLHELAHFVMARHHHVEASLPYFLPVPPPYLLFGTFGAFISLREPIPNKRALLDIGASGPLAGFAVSIPVTLAGAFLSAHSPVLSVANCGPTILGVSYSNLQFGPSIFWLALGKFLPAAFFSLHPLALAGWVGLLVTAINLLPAGQLDGGHVFRALLGDRSRYVSWAAVILLFGLGVFYYQGWIIFAILIFLLGVRHPPPLNDISPLDAKRWALGAFAVAILVTGFVVVPIAQPTGEFSLTALPTAKVTPLPLGAAMADNLSLRVHNQDQAAHGYLFSATVTSVVASVNGSVRPLNGPALSAFLMNSTWIVSLPNGNHSTFSGTGNWALPTSDYSSIDSGASGTLNVLFQNTAQAQVTISVTVSELCPALAAGSQSQSFQAT